MFERLTADKVYLNSIRFGIQVNFPPHCGHEKAKEVDDFVKNVFDRLAAYEDSGLSPEEVQELAKAKADGRVMMLPCKVGDTVYRIISYKCNAVCNKLNACNSFIYKGCKQSEFYVCPGTFQFNDIEWIGKTVFLTREAAEKALGVGE
jgi:hypothetical protein